MLIIKKYWPDYVPGYIKCEGPDWVNPNDSTGIEITRTMSTHEGYSDSLARKYFGKKRHDIPSEILEVFHGELFYREDGTVIGMSPSKGLVNASSFYNQIVQSFDTKVSKLLKYKTFSRNILYLYHSFLLNQKEIESLLDVFSIKTGLYFHIVFLDTIDQLITYDIEAKTYKIDEKLGDMKALIIQAEELVSYSLANKQVVVFDDMIRSCFSHEEQLPIL